MPGTATSAAEVTNISQHGFWMLIDGSELFLPFEEFPWFKRATVEAILRIEQPTPGHLRWPELDVDLSVDSIEQPTQARFERLHPRLVGHHRHLDRAWLSTIRPHGALATTSLGLSRSSRSMRRARQSLIGKAIVRDAAN
jgi:hypothetical protein